MTIDISANVPRISYTVAAGVTQTSFAVPFEFFDDSDLNVYIDQVLQTITTNYTVTGGSGSTGTVTMTVTGPKTVIITRDTTIERTTDFTAGVDINRAALNTQLDTLTAIAADNKDFIERSIRIKDFDPTTASLELPDATTRANKLLSFDTEGGISVQAASDLLTGSVLGANYTKASHTGDGTTVAFSTTEAAGSKNNIQVYIDGVYQNKDTFSISGSTLTFSEAPPLSSAIEFIVGNAVTSITGDASAITYDQGDTGAQERTLKSRLKDFVTFKDFGASGDGSSNDSSSIDAAVTAHDLIHGTEGNYLYKSETTADPSRIKLSSAAEIKGMKSGTVNIGARNKDGDFIGFMQNYNETRNDNIASPITTGTFISPPISNATPVPGVDVMAYWYNDFGLECVRDAGGAIGSTQWYTWQWAHTVDGATTYDPNINPLLGWYRGDDPIVLNWICYWLREAGVKGLLLVGRGSLADTTSWATSTEQNHWLYQLFNNTPNFKGLSYVPAIASGGSLVDAQALDTNLQTNILPVYDNFYVTSINGKNYGTIWSYDLGTLRTGTYSGNITNFENMLASYATFFKNKGLDGVCVLGRFASYYTADSATAKTNKARVSALDVEVFDLEYGNFSGVTSGSDTYDVLVDNFYSGYQATKYSTIPNVMTARQSHGGFHPSGWVNTGSTPALFEKAAQQAATMAVANQTIPNIMTVYNVSEWGEGGPALQPTVGRGFGYLDAIRNINVPLISKTGVGTNFYKEAEVKSGTASTGIAFKAFTVICSGVSVTSVEVTIAAYEQTGNFANQTKRINLNFKRTGGVLSLAGQSDVFVTDVNNANYTITIAATATIVDSQTAEINLTLTSGGTIGWTNADYIIRAVTMSTEPVAIE